MPGFDYQHPVTGTLFVDRDKELQEISKRLEGGANVLVIAPRRMGKSSLIAQAFKHARSYQGFYVTCPHKGTGHDLAEAILAQIALPLPKRMKNWFVEQAQTLRPVAVLEPTGIWRFTFDRLEPPRKVLAETAKLLDKVADKLGKPVALAIDEVQRILERDPDSFHALRDVVQFQPQVRYVLSGSKYHVLERLLDAESPFGHQLTPIYVAGIPIQEFGALARKQFKNAGNTLDEETFQRVGEICKGNPKRTQELLFDLLAVQAPTPDDADPVATRQIESQRHLFEDLLDQVRLGNPMDVLVGLAIVPPGTPVYGQAFLAESGAKTPGNVKSAIESLRRRGLIDDKHRFVDPYLRAYLRMQDPKGKQTPFA